MAYFVYILASKRQGTLYIGVTNDLVRRTYEHKENLIDGFPEKYGATKLVYFEEYPGVRDALQREKNLKHWSRDWKIALIEKSNPDWADLYVSVAS